MEDSLKIQYARLKEFTEHYTRAWCSQDPASVAAHFAPHGFLCINKGVPAVGRNAIAESARGFMVAFPDLQVLMNEFVIQDGRPIYRWTLIGTNTGPGGTGRRVKISGFELWKLTAEGLIAESHGTFDAAEYQRQLESYNTTSQ